MGPGKFLPLKTFLNFNFVTKEYLHVQNQHTVKSSILLYLVEGLRKNLIQM
jgi:hypothetical protein